MKITIPTIRMTACVINLLVRSDMLMTRGSQLMCQRQHPNDYLCGIVHVLGTLQVTFACYEQMPPLH
jgi:hypothetical protein